MTVSALAKSGWSCGTMRLPLRKTRFRRRIGSERRSPLTSRYSQLRIAKKKAKWISSWNAFSPGSEHCRVIICLIRMIGIGFCWQADGSLLA